MLNEYDLSRENKQEFADAIVLIFSSLKINLDPFVTYSPIIVNDG